MLPSRLYPPHIQLGVPIPRLHLGAQMRHHTIRHFYRPHHLPHQCLSLPSHLAQYIPKVAVDVASILPQDLRLMHKQNCNPEFDEHLVPLQNEQPPQLIQGSQGQLLRKKSDEPACRVRLCGYLQSTQEFMQSREVIEDVDLQHVAQLLYFPQLIHVQQLQPQVPEKIHCEFIGLVLSESILVHALYHAVETSYAASLPSTPIMKHLIPYSSRCDLLGMDIRCTSTPMASRQFTILLPQNPRSLFMVCIRRRTKDLCQRKGLSERMRQAMTYFERIAALLDWKVESQTCMISIRVSESRMRKSVGQSSSTRRQVGREDWGIPWGTLSLKWITFLFFIELLQQSSQLLSTDPLPQRLCFISDLHHLRPHPIHLGWGIPSLRHLPKQLLELLVPPLQLLQIPSALYGLRSHP